MCTPMDKNRHNKKDFLDTLDSKDPERIGRMLSEMSDSDFARLGQDLWDDEVHEENVDTEEAFRSFKARTGCLDRLAVSAVRLAVAGVAAVVVAVSGFWAGMSYDKEAGEPSVQAVAWTECCTDYGKTSSIVLPDSTRVWLNSASRLLYPEKFTGETREIYLSGEIYIEVAKDSLHPFIVNAGGIGIRVTGTRFNVKAYQEDCTVTTTLIEGGVDVSLPGRDVPVTLVPGNALSYDIKRQDYDLYQVAPGSYPSWYEGEFNAYHMTLAQIARDLERRFGVDIVIRNPEVADEMFYASFVNSEDVDMILSSLNIDGSFTVRRDGNFIDIY